MTRRLPLFMADSIQHPRLTRSTDAGATGHSTPDQAEGGPELFIRRAFETDAERGYALLFKRYYGLLCSHAARFVYARDIAEDIVGEVFSQFWQPQRHRSVTTSFRAYLFTMCATQRLPISGLSLAANSQSKSCPSWTPPKDYPHPSSCFSSPNFPSGSSRPFGRCRPSVSGCL